MFVLGWRILFPQAEATTPYPLVLSVRCGNMAGGRDEDVSADQVVNRYLRLTDRSKKAITVLEGLPLYAANCSSVDPFVGRAFESLNELWKLQMSARSVLESAYKLKRWEIGEIASRLGQLHHYAYTRRGDPESLKSAFYFYNVIQQRKYLELPPKVDARHGAFIVKKMRVQARFAVVCIHMNKVEELEDALRSIRKLVDVLQELSPMSEEVDRFGKLLLEGRAVTDVLVREREINPRLSDRCATRRPVSGALVFSHAVLASNQEMSLKFSELPLCTLRLSQALDWQTPQKHGPPTQKHYMYRPTVSELVTQVASVGTAMLAGSALLLYINANAAEGGLDLGEGELLCTLDLYVAMRKPLFVILEGKGVKKWFNEGSLKGRDPSVPFVAMVGEDGEHLSRFLTSPVAALARGTPAGAAVASCTALVDACAAGTAQLLHDADSLHPSLAPFLASPFASRFLAHFALCHAAAEDPPLVFPPLPEAVLADPSLSSCVEQVRNATADS